MADPSLTVNLAVSPAPQVNADVEYFGEKAIAIDITNLLSQSILLEDVILQFQADTGSAPIYVDHRCGIELAGNRLASLSLRVMPTCQFLAYTNVFRVMVHYRINHDGRLGNQISENHLGSYLIVKPPKDSLGKAFISFKQPEDIALARTLERYARRAGLNPFLIMDDRQPGTSHWDRIEEAIRSSGAAFVVWGERTEWGTGVQREIGLCRKHSVKEVLLLEQSLSVPELFRDTAAENEYSRFHKEDPAASLDRAVMSVRNRFLNVVKQQA